MRSRRAVSRSTTLIAVTLIAGAFVHAPAPLAAQGGQRAIDRWLVTHTRPLVAGENPLEIDGATLFPDRDLTVGPGYWRLLRDDGRVEFALDGGGDRPASATTALAHAYIKVPYDLTVDLRVDGPACASATVWVNGQAVPVAESSEDSPIRLAGGWNTLLVALDGDGGCAHRLGVTLSPTAAPVRDDDEPADFERISVQASRPPGARPNQPNGALVLQSPIPVGLTWHAGTDELLASVSYAVSSWGGVLGEGRLRLEDGDDIPEGPPTVDLTGEWVITLYTPTGIMTSHTTLEMADDGALTGRLQGERLEGDIQDGWVHGDEFGWRMRFEGRGRDLDVVIRGILTDDVMTGTLDFGGFQDFEARFEGERAPADAEGEGTEADGEADEESADAGRTEDEETTESSDREVAATPPPPDPQADLPQTPAPGDVDPAERERDELAAPADPDGQRARIIRQLLPPSQRPPDPAPASGSMELSIGGQKLTGSFEGLEPLRPQAMTGEIEFDRLRKAALDKSGVEARVLWQDKSYDFVGSVSAAKLLEAVHRPIRLDGWGLAGADGFVGAFRVPGALDGFTLRVGEGEWRVDGAPLSGDILCQPCDGGSRFDLAVAGTETPFVEIVDPGYNAARDGTDVPDANAWLEALRGNNDAYRELGRRFGSVERD